MPNRFDRLRISRRASADQPSNNIAKTNVTRYAPAAVLPRFLARSCYMFDITAPSRLLSVTESVALPPQPDWAAMSPIAPNSIFMGDSVPVLLPILLAALIAAAAQTASS
jgi:hypothetical protein